ncbi:MAG: ATP-binding cassette domain-containing protein, partial [Halanaerobiales bacterium]
MSNNIILDVDNLQVRFFYEQGTVKAVNGVSYHLEEGQSAGIVGESGCGKTVSTYAVLNILSSAGKIISGSIRYKREDGTAVDLAHLHPESEEMRSIRGKEISMIFQEPMTALSPVHTIYNQISEAIISHQNIRKEQVRERVIDLLEKVGIPDPVKRVDDYPFQMSGGMRQRAMI